MRKLIVSAPSNIALVKYMGKTDSALNLPANPSLSMTLESLCTVVQIDARPAERASARWNPELPEADAKNPSLGIPKLTEKGIARMLAHVERTRAAAPAILAAHGLKSTPSTQALSIRTANSFPAGSGIASSASSFAALTVAAAGAVAHDLQSFAATFEQSESLKRDLARVSRQGSGSSCRSLLGPWVAWEDADIRALPSSLPPLAHFVALVSEREKSVSSSEAHQRVASSPLWQGRPARAAARAEALEAALGGGSFERVAALAWEEAWEMHSLFHTSQEPFTYWEPETVALLKWLAPFVRSDSPPVVTLDAGPNVHVIVPASQKGLWRTRFREQFPRLALLEDQPGRGACVLRAEPLGPEE